MQPDLSKKKGGYQHYTGVMADEMRYVSSSDDRRTVINVKRSCSKGGGEGSNGFAFHTYLSAETTSSVSARRLDEASEIRKSCDSCIIRKKRCDGNGMRTCRLVVYGTVHANIDEFQLGHIISPSKKVSRSPRYRLQSLLIPSERRHIITAGGLIRNAFGRKGNAYLK